MVTTKRTGDWYEIIIPAEWEMYNPQELFKDYWHAPKKLIHQMRMENDVKLNGEKIAWHLPIKRGDKLQIRLFKEEKIHLAPFYYELEVLYEDDHLAVFNKPANMDTHPNSNDQNDTLANAATFHMQAIGELRNIKHIHRLDKNTSGAILFAKHPLAGAILDKLLEERVIKRTYYALVHGIVNINKGVIEQPIGRDRHHATRRRVSSSGQSAKTNFEVIEKFPKEKLTLIKCQLDTGRTHQIRVHLSYIGHPLAGDKLYGGKPLFNRQALHAAKLEWPHPFTKEMIKVICPPPSELLPYFQSAVK